MRRLNLVIFIAAAALLAAAIPAEAQKFQPKAIVFKGDAEYSDEELLAAAGLKKGVALSVDEMKAHFQKLMDAGVFESVLYKFDGQDLVFQLSPSALLYPIRLENLPLTPGKDLEAQIHARLPLFHGKVPPEGGLLEDTRHVLEDLLAVQGI